MWLIVGLGNPGRSYQKTRHNLGFMVVEAISSKFSTPIEKETKNYIYGKGTVNDKAVVLAKPLTFMNLSGIAVSAMLNKFMNVENIIVIHDDLDLETGVLKIKRGGSSGGHRGIESIIKETGSKDFIRIKLGIGRPQSKSVEDYVLSPFSKEEQPLAKECIEKAVEAVSMVIDKGLSYAQNKLHVSKGSSK
ncbi:MAG: aminoacyl-tRNA hydrolase [Nitrospirae bacterium]|nr:aminoacyl-tRNA hydrolase [Nitrospirota bacterium]